MTTLHKNNFFRRLVSSQTLAFSSGDCGSLLVRNGLFCFSAAGQLVLPQAQKPEATGKRTLEAIKNDGLSSATQIPE